MVMAVKQFQKLFRTTAGLNVDKNDINRLSSFNLRPWRRGDA